MRILIPAILMCLSGASLFAQSSDDVRSKATASASKTLNLGSVAFQARVKGRDKNEIVDGIVAVQQLGNQKRLSYDQATLTNQTAPKGLQERLLAASGSNSPAIYSFDGVHAIEYSPLRLSLIRRPGVEIDCPRILAPLFPDNWLCVSGIPLANVTLFLTEAHGASAEVPKDPQGMWVFSKDYTEKFAFRRIQMTVDPSKEYHVSLIETSGGLGNSKVQLEWEQDATSKKWFPRKATIDDYRGFELTWHIEAIDFSASSIAEPFRLDDKDMPIGTRVTVFSKDEKGAEKTTTHFVGGEEGSLEYKLRKRAIGKIREESK